jgi:hypothetical protein
MKLFSKIVLAAVVGTVATIASATSAHAFGFNVTTGLNSPTNATNQGAFSDYQALPGVFNIDFNNGTAPTTGPVQYSFENGSRSSIRQDNWAPSGAAGQVNTGKYLAVFNGDKVTMNLDTQFNYFGIDWGAISDNNTFSFFNGNTQVASYNTQDINPLATVVGQSHGGQKNGYVHFFTTGANESFNRIVISQSSNAGGGFESDNHSFKRGTGVFDPNPTKTPEPTAMLGLALASGAAVLKRKRAA